MPQNDQSYETDASVKHYYIRGERYDWVTDPRRLERLFHSRRRAATLKCIARHKRGSAIVDLGCGTGLITGHLQNGLVVGMDISRWNLERAQTHAPGVAAVQGDLERLPFASASFDTVVCTETLEHVPDPHQALREMWRILKPGGRLIGSVPSKTWIWRLRRFTLSTCPRAEPFHHNYSVAEVRKMLMMDHARVLELFSAVLGLSVFFVVEKPAPPS